MAVISLTFSTDPQLTGAAVNDSVYYIDSGVTTATSNDVINIGTIQAFTGGGTEFIILVDTGSLNFTMPTAADYVFFSKNNEVNMGSLIGYYANVKFVNDSTEEAELYATAAEISESSK
jgi:hypothetical protein